MSIKNFLDALEVPPMYYDWSVEKLPSGKTKKSMLQIIENTDQVISLGGLIVINLKDTLLASRLGVTILKSALLKGFIDVFYLTPEKIMDYKAESWSQGDMYEEAVKSSLVIIDDVSPNVGGARYIAYLEFFEERLKYKRATVIISNHAIGLITNDRIKVLLTEVITQEIKDV
jgi:hypothetical protein